MEKAKYDPEDIESLLANKEFGELYPEEKEFVLRHLENETEYRQMRETLIGINRVNEEDVLISPSEKIKETLMDLFEARNRKRPFLIWLNAFFTSAGNRISALFAQPKFAYSLATFCIALIGWFIWDGLQSERMQFAEHQTSKIQEADRGLENANSNSERLDQSTEIDLAKEQRIDKGVEELELNEDIKENISANKAGDNLTLIENESSDKEVDPIVLDKAVSKNTPPLILEEPQSGLNSELTDMYVDDTEREKPLPKDESLSDFNKIPASMDNLKSESDLADSKINRNEIKESADKIAPVQIEEVAVSAQSRKINRVQVINAKTDEPGKELREIPLSRSAKTDIDLMDLLFTAL